MPELPDVTVYAERIDALLGGQKLDRIELGNPFLLRSVAPDKQAFAGRKLRGCKRLGKRLVLDFEGDFYAVIHLMIAGRLHLHPPDKKLARSPKSNQLAMFRFEHNALLLTEAGRKRRASIYLLDNAADLATHDRGGLEVLAASPEAFRETLRQENHTLKRALTDPRILSGIGNAYSDEILFRARLSPFQRTSDMDDATLDRLLDAVQTTLREFTDAIRAQTGEGFPAKVTAFRPDMAVHGRFGKPCPACGKPIQRIVYAANEANYCAQCQLGGRLLADRALSRLLKSNWPKSLEELEDKRRPD